MMGTTSTGTNSISRIKTYLLQKFSPQVFSVTDDDSVKISCCEKNIPLYGTVNDIPGTVYWIELKK